MNFSIEQLFELLKFEPGAGMLHSILLLLIWLNVRSLRKVLSRLEEDHELRITGLEYKTGIREIPVPIKP